MVLIGGHSWFDGVYLFTCVGAYYSLGLIKDFSQTPYILFALFSSQVKGISGPNRGLIGTLINIDEGDGIVKLDVDSVLKIISLDQLAKYVPRRH